MNNVDIHKTLSDIGVRDYLGKELNKNYSFMTVEQSKVLLDAAQAQYDKAIKYAALDSLIKSNGWEWLDCSDEIDDYSPATYFNFVGTKDEYKKIFGDDANDNTL